MSSAGTVNGRGFVISYSVQTNVDSNRWCTGGYSVTIDTVVVNVQSTNPGDTHCVNKSDSGSHKFFTSKIGLAFTTGSISGKSATGSGNMKYILGT